MELSMVGSEKLLSPQKSPLWVKASFIQKGKYLYGNVYLVKDGNPKVVQARVNLKMLIRALHRRALNRRPEMRIEGFDLFKSIGRTAKKIGKIEIVRKAVNTVKDVGKVAKDVVKSPITKYTLTGLSALMAATGVGLPAAGALGAATLAISAAEKGIDAAEDAKKVYDTARKGARDIKKISKALRGKKRRRKSSRRKRKLSAAAIRKKIQLILRNKRLPKAMRARLALSLKAALKRAKGRKKSSKRRRPPIFSVLSSIRKRASRRAKSKSSIRRRLQRLSPTTRRRLKARVKKSSSAIRRWRKLRSSRLAKRRLAKRIRLKNKVQKRFQKIANTARFSKNPIKRDKAQKLARIVRIAAEAKAKANQLAIAQRGGLPGLFIDGRGRLTPGKFQLVTHASPQARRGVVYQGPHKQFPSGQFERIAGASPTLSTQEAIVRARATMKKARALGMSHRDLKRLHHELMKRVQIINSQTVGCADCPPNLVGCPDCPPTINTVGYDCIQIGTC